MRNNSEKKENNRYYSENKCDLCDYPRPSGTKHIHFIKGKKNHGRQYETQQI